MATASQLRV
jgi:hypothetical protein